jgi:hypothetical protein
MAVGCASNTSGCSKTWPSLSTMRTVSSHHAVKIHSHCGVASCLQRIPSTFFSIKQPAVKGGDCSLFLDLSCIHGKVDLDEEQAIDKDGILWFRFRDTGQSQRGILVLAFVLGFYPEYTGSAKRKKVWSWKMLCIVVVNDDLLQGPLG